MTNYPAPDQGIPCPFCGYPCDCDTVDIGVGYQQCGPYHCDQCGASEIGCHDEERPLTAEEKKCGWYGPDSKPGSSANVIAGMHVSHDQMKTAYRAKFKGNPLWHDKAYVKDWWENIRKIWE